ncbi:unnamed protein product [Mycena citricolor]|uniref:Uncharacterized protein n=1 Tax=Mycena citricolor TaxID=2018698 RepID=A0AAD2H8Z6_9AGAR|nr:unnamed protein product [Mycena citricolor]
MEVVLCQELSMIMRDHIPALSLETHPAPLPHLPQELREIIISSIHCKKTLKSCALAGQSLRIPAQRALFRTLTLDKSTTRKGQRIHEQFVASARIASYLRKLVIFVPRRLEAQKSIGILLETILRMQLPVCEIFGDSFGSDIDADDATAVWKPLATLVVRLAHLPSMSVVQIHRSFRSDGMLIKGILSSTSVQTLCIWIRVPRSERPLVALVFSRSARTACQFDSCILPHGALTPHVLRLLRAVHQEVLPRHLLVVGVDGHELPLHLLGSTAHAVQELTLIPRFGNLNTFLSLPCLPSLHTLTLRAFLVADSRDRSLTLSVRPIFPALKSCGAAMSLKFVILSIQSGPLRSSPESKTFPVEDFRLIDTPNFRASFPALRSVECTLHVEEHPGAVHDWETTVSVFRKTMEDSFPALHRAGVLCFSKPMNLDVYSWDVILD